MAVAKTGVARRTVVAAKRDGRHLNEQDLA
jgi:hypothetical protein